MFPQTVVKLAEAIAPHKESNSIFALKDALLEAGEPYLAEQCMMGYDDKGNSIRYPDDNQVVHLNVRRVVDFILLQEHLWDRRAALAESLGVSENEIIYTGYSPENGGSSIGRFEHWERAKAEDGEMKGSNVEYLVVTDEEADQKYEDSLRLELHCLFPRVLRYAISEEVMDDVELERNRRNGNNDALYNVILDWDDFVAEVRTIEDRGERLSAADGSENYEVVNGVTYYIYCHG